MILLDLNQVIISNIMAQVGSHTNIPIEINLIRHMVLNQIRMLNNKYRTVYGDMVIASDGPGYWRKEVFPFYKANRSAQRKESDFDWNALFECLNTIRQELIDFMPYPVIHVAGAEADDIIGVLVAEAPRSTKIMIVSGDGDFAQLQQYDGVAQYDPIRKRPVISSNPVDELYLKIIKGDTGDGIPNILSPDDTFVKKIRQKKITQRVLERDDLRELPGFIRNQKLIDLAAIPKTVSQKILNEYQAQLSTRTRERMFTYMMAMKLHNLIQHINEF